MWFRNAGSLVTDTSVISPRLDSEKASYIETMKTSCRDNSLYITQVQRWRFSAMNTWTRKQTKCTNLAGLLTCLVGCDVKRHVLAEWFGELRDTVHSLHLKGVVCVGEQVKHHDWRVAKAGALGKVAHVAPARFVLLRLGAHLPADHAVGHVLPATRLLRGAPLQQHACLVYIWNSTAWGWRRLWGTCRWKLL